MQPGESRPQPVEIEVVRSSHLRIRWTDGADHTIPLADVRRNCPCATCRHEREQAVSSGGLRVIQRPAAAADSTTVISASLVGHYAVQIAWKDGHSSGIYDYALLHRLGQASRAAQPGAPP
jgi:DUF971 family protein